jgi:HSP20 family protein
MNDTANLVNRENGQDLARNNTGDRQHDAPRALVPPVDVIEDSSGVTLLADLPGVSRDKLTLNIAADRLTIDGEVALDLPEQMESRFAEINVPRYQRSFTLSKDLDGERASAELKNGVLRLHIPKASHAQPKRIQITAA